MLRLLDRQQKLTGNQRRIVLAAILGDMLEFYDYFMIGFVLAFIVGPWKLTYGQGAFILLSSGIGAIGGAWFWGWLADRIGRRKVFMAGFGVGGLYCVDLPLVQEFVPSAKRGAIGGLVTCAIPVGIGLGAVLGAYLAPAVGWRGLFAVGGCPRC
jgi:MFS transporter, putative metabolite:H+ symporter